MTRQATVLVSDEWTYSLNGKTNAFGIYTNDIVIPKDPTEGFQLIFMFIIETAPDDPFQTLEVAVELPGGDSRRLPIGLPGTILSVSDQRRWCTKFPLLFARPILKPGFIEAKVIHERGEISAAAPAIVLAGSTPPAAH
jgi:hypothetical protein